MVAKDKTNLATILWKIFAAAIGNNVIKCNVLNRSNISITYKNLHLNESVVQGHTSYEYGNLGIIHLVSTQKWNASIS